MELYKKHVDEDGIFHLGSDPYSIVVDIDSDGNIDLNTDTELIEAYGKGRDEGVMAKKMRTSTGTSTSVLKQPD